MKKTASLMLATALGAVTTLGADSIMNHNKNNVKPGDYVVSILQRVADRTPTTDKNSPKIDFAKLEKEQKKKDYEDFLEWKEEAKKNGMFIPDNDKRHRIILAIQHDVSEVRIRKMYAKARVGTYYV